MTVDGDRPAEVVRFETLALIACLLNLTVSWNIGPYPWSGFAAAAANGSLILWAARGRSSVARILQTAWLALVWVLILVGWAVARHLAIGFPGSSLGISLIALALDVAAFFYLWSKGFGRWLAGSPV